MKTVTKGPWGFSVTIGMGSRIARAYTDDQRRSLDLSQFDKATADRLADRWGMANGFIKKYRRKASFRRFLKRMRNG